MIGLIYLPETSFLTWLSTTLVPSLFSFNVWLEEKFHKIDPMLGGKHCVLQNLLCTQAPTLSFIYHLAYIA